jgi:hypothetical protein
MVRQGVFLLRLSKKSIGWMPRIYNNPQDHFVSYLFASVNHASGVELLGGAVTEDTTFASAVANRRDNKCTAVILQLLKIPDPQICLLLLRSCLGMTKLSYCFRTMPPAALVQASANTTSILVKALNFIITDDKSPLGPL